MRTASSKSKQLAFKNVRGWGGKRRGAGRPSHGGRVNHMKREPVNFKKPLHLTIKLQNRTCNLRCGEIAAAFKASATGAQKFGLHVLHFSILRDHVHLIVEAKDNECLSRGMRSFGSRFAKGIRRIVGGRGPVFHGRFHLHVIDSPTQMRNSLAYVLQNFAKHSTLIHHVDRYSSASHFTEWRALLGREAGPLLADVAVAHGKRADKSGPRHLPHHLSLPRSWLAREGWKRGRILTPKTNGIVKR